MKEQQFFTVAFLFAGVVELNRKVGEHMETGIIFNIQKFCIHGEKVGLALLHAAKSIEIKFSRQLLP